MCCAWATQWETFFRSISGTSEAEQLRSALLRLSSPSTGSFNVDLRPQKEDESDRYVRTGQWRQRLCGHWSIVKGSYFEWYFGNAGELQGRGTSPWMSWSSLSAYVHWATDYQKYDRKRFVTGFGELPRASNRWLPVPHISEYLPPLWNPPLR
jgi:hypothetical protein